MGDRAVTYAFIVRVLRLPLDGSIREIDYKFTLRIENLRDIVMRCKANQIEFRVKESRDDDEREIVEIGVTGQPFWYLTGVV